MELITILNRCHRFRGFVYQHAHFSADKKSIEVAVRPRRGSAAVCSRCHLPAPGYDQLAERRFEFIPLWGFLVFLLYTMRRVNCRRCGIVAVEEVPWGDGKRTLTKAYMLFLARWARRLSWKETAEAFRTSWEKVFDAVEHVVTFGLESKLAFPISPRTPCATVICRISSMRSERRKRFRFAWRALRKATLSRDASRALQLRRRPAAPRPLPPPLNRRKSAVRPCGTAEDRLAQDGIVRGRHLIPCPRPYQSRAAHHRD